MKPPRVKKILKFIFPPALLLAILAISYFHLLDSYELETLDIRFHLRPKIPVTDKVVFIDIGDDTIERLGRFPFDRSYHALLIKALSSAGVKGVIFDIFFSESADNDIEIEDALREGGNIYFPYVFYLNQKHKNILSATGYAAKNIENFTLLAKGTGHINIVPDIDGKFRRVPLYIRYGNALYPYVSFLAGINDLEIKEKDVKILPGKYLSAGGMKIPLDENSSMLINFSGKWGQGYKHYSYVDVLQSYISKSSGQLPPLNLKMFKDKICIVGLTATGTVDLHPIPLEPLYPGVGIHAEILNSLINKSFIARASRSTNIWILLGLSLLIAVLTLVTRPLKGLLLLLACIAAFSFLAILLFNIFGLWIDIVYPVFIASIIYISLTLYKYLAEWKKRLVMENELDIAKTIQDSFLPKKIPQARSLDISAAMFTARKVGGDLYDFIEFDPARLGVMIGDVSGKGIPASLFMSMVAGKFKALAANNADPQKVLSDLNAALVKESASNLFVTMLYLIFDMYGRKVIFSNGGHLPILYLPKDGDVEFLDVEEGAPLGLMDGSYLSREIKFKEGDVFVLYTDGVTEAMNVSGEMYGKERLGAVVKSGRSLSSKSLLNAIEKDIRRFEPKASQHDDITMIVIKAGSVDN